MFTSETAHDVPQQATCRIGQAGREGTCYAWNLGSADPLTCTRAERSIEYITEARASNYETTGGSGDLVSVQSTGLCHWSNSTRPSVTYEHDSHTCGRWRDCDVERPPLASINTSLQLKPVGTDSIGALLLVLSQLGGTTLTSAVAGSRQA